MFCVWALFSLTIFAYIYFGEAGMLPNCSGHLTQMIKPVNTIFHSSHLQRGWQGLEHRHPGHLRFWELQEELFRAALHQHRQWADPVLLQPAHIRLGTGETPIIHPKLSLKAKKSFLRTKCLLESTWCAFFTLVLPNFHLNGNNMSSFVTLRFKRDGKAKICCCLYLRENEVRDSPFMQSRGSVLPLGAENGLLLLNDLVSPLERSYKSSQTRVN